jgi:hypothetical protein
MRVRCVAITGSDGRLCADSAWIKVASEYPVLSLLVTSDGKTMLQVMSEDRRTPAWFAASMFETIDTSIAPNWVAKLRDDGVLALGPQNWLEPGFWESYFDGDAQARSDFDAESEAINLADAERGHGRTS